MIPVKVLAVRYLANASPTLCKQLGIPKEYPSLGLITTDSDDPTYIALDAALGDVRKGLGGDFPRHQQNVHADSYTMEREQGYKYPHDYPGNWVEQQYLPDELVGTHYYRYGNKKLEQAAKYDEDMEHGMHPPYLTADAKENGADGIADATKEQKHKSRHGQHSYGLTHKRQNGPTHANVANE